MNEKLITIANVLKGVFRKYHIHKAIVFGSYAKGGYTPKSDLDMVLIKNTSLAFFARYKGIYEAIYEKLKNIEIDLLIYTPRELKNISHRKFIQKIMNEGVAIYEQGKKPIWS